MPAVSLRLLPSLFFPAVLAAADPAPFNTEKDGGSPMSAAGAAEQWKLPEGFQATVFAAEPEIRQPIAMCLDERGRLWVAESDTFAGHLGGYWEKSLRDRIVILEDTDHDGRHDRRTVFAEGLERLTSIERGMGGVWALTLPHLVFIPDQDRDDKPDGPPRVILDGFDIEHSAHTMANGLRWGPDGWLYGRQGILGTSLIGPPGTPDPLRARISPGIWRVHPQRHTVEVVCEGTTNPWGMDWNELGEAFFINTVIGHLWHVIPGAHYRRMFGEDLNPHVYHLIEQHADHVHWDAGEIWSDVRKIGVSQSSSSAGGGHAHTGLMIYLGDNWPEAYRGGMFTINFHGRRLNHDRLEPTGSGYTGRHAADLAQSADPWFRGIDLLYGPDGGVFVSDWSDTGECHDDDGVHRGSGRIYKIAHGKPAVPAVTDLGRLDEAELVALLHHRNEWFARRARLELQARAAAGVDLTTTAGSLRRQFAEATNPVHQLRALWSLHAIRHADQAFLLGQLGHPSVPVRTWAIRLLLDDKATAGNDLTTRALAGRAQQESSSVVRLALASALQRLPLAARPAIARPLLARAEDATDHNLPLMLWYGLEPLARDHAQDLADLAGHCRIPMTLTCIARRLAEDMSDPSGALQSMLQHAATAPASWQTAVLGGIAEAQAGIRQAVPPPAWSGLARSIIQCDDEELKRLYLSLGATFGDPVALDLNRRLALDDAAPAERRGEAFRSLVNARAPGLRELCESLFGTPDLTAAAADGLGLGDDPAAAAFMIQRFATVPPADKPAVVSVLVSRPESAALLLDAIESKAIATSELNAFHVRQIHALGREALAARVEKLWGKSRESGADQRALMDRWKAHLTPAVLAGADKPAGRALFANLCGTCHRMYGQGGAIGPDLTGSGRDNLDYLLTHVIDPGAVVARDQQLSVLTLKDGRVLSGIIRRQDDRSLTLQTMLEPVSLPAGDVAKIETLPTSLMPEGLLGTLRESEVRDLIGWLMDKGPPAAAAKSSVPAIEPAGDWQIKVAVAGSTESITLDVAPPPVLTVAAESFAALPLYNSSGGGWNNGARLAGNLAEACTTPGLIDIPSVIVRPAAGGEPFVRGKDWEIENDWGTFGRLPGGAIGEATPVAVAYRHSAQRLDSIVVDARGAISIRQGAAVPANALPPALASGEARLANVWIPGPLAKLSPSNIFPVLETSWPEPPPAATPPALAGIREKLLSGQPVRIVAWGDSVTDAAYLPQAGKWQEQFAARLREAFPTAKTEWITEAWGGRSTLDYLNAAPGSGRNFQEQILARKPDLVISEFVNDAHLPLESTVPRYEKILAAFRDSGAAWIILTPHYVRPDWMQLAGEQQVDLDPRPYVATLREFAATRPVALADASRRYGRLWRQGIPHTTLLVNSINHPDARGMKLFADSLMDLFPPAAKP